MPRAEAIGLVFVVVIVFFAPIGLLTWWYVRSKNRRTFDTLAALANAFGVAEVGAVSTPTSLVPVPGFEASRGGRTFRVFQFARGSHSFVELQLVTEQTLPLMVLRRERALDRLGRAVGLNREVQTGDAAFDAAVYIESDESDAAIAKALGEQPTRDAVRAAVDAVGTVTVARHAISAVFSTDAAAADDEAVARTIAALEGLEPRLVDVEGARGVAGRARGDMASLGWALFAVVYLLFLFLGAVRADHFEPIDREGQRAPLGLGLVAYVVSLVCAYFYIRGHSRSLRNFIVFALSHFFPLLLGPTTVAWPLNAAGDGAPPVTVTTSVRSKRVSRGNRSRSYWLKLESDRGETFDIIVPSSVYDDAQVGDRRLVEVRSGWLGWRYIGKVSAPP